MLTSHSPIYHHILDLIRLLQALGIECSHDSYLDSYSSRENNCDLSPALMRSIEQSQYVVVVWSEVMSEALSGAGKVGLIQTRFGTFKAMKLKHLMKNSPNKFIPVSLSKEAPVLSGSPLQGSHCYCVGESLLSLVEGLASGQLQEKLSSGENSELQQLVDILRAP